MSFFSPGQLKQLANALRTAGFTRRLVTQLGQSQAILQGLILVLKGEAEIKIIVPPPPPMPKTLKELMESPLGASIMERLKAANTYILLAESEAIMSQSGSVSIDGSGFVHSTQVVGMAAAYTTRKAVMRPMSPEEALESIRDYGEEMPEEDLVKMIVEQAPLKPSEASIG